MTKRILLLISTLIIIPVIVFAAATDYLILQDIGPYKLFTGISGRVFSGPPSKFSQTNTGGVLDAAGHFSESDVSYDASYTESSSKWPFVKVEVTQHSGVDTDKWLLHELDVEFRNYYGIPGNGYAIVPIEGNYIFEFGSAGWDYRWLSGTKVIKIEYHDSQMTKVEPLEIVKAYLVKHPSTIPATTLSQLRSSENKTQWIKDEMDRRLWLCDKWFAQLSAGKTDQKTALNAAAKSMNVFLDYREKYYSIAGKDEKNLLSKYLNQNDSTNIQAKLTGYKTWWSAHKDNSIALP